MKKSLWKRMMALCTAGMLLFHTAAFADGLSEETRNMLNTAIVLAQTDLEGNSGTIRIVLEKCIDASEGDVFLESIASSIIVLLDSGKYDTESVVLLLQAVLDNDAANLQEEPAGVQSEPQTEEPAGVQGEPQTEEPAGVQGEPQTEAPSQEEASPFRDRPDLGLPKYEVTSFIKTLVSRNMLVDVPGDWGNNGSGRSLTNYSPVNASGAIDPAAGTLLVSYFPMEDDTPEEAYNSYVESTASMTVVHDMKSEDTTAADIPARRMEFTMRVGANAFSCETVCFAYADTIFVIELMQGGQTVYDYFPVFDQVVYSAEVGDQEKLEETMRLENERTEEQTEAPTEKQTEVQTERQTEAQTGEQAGVDPGDGGSQVSSDLPADIGSFQYELDGVVYAFPTMGGDLQSSSLKMDPTLLIPYNFRSDADMTDGAWTEIANTQYFSFDNSQYKEMAGFTNLKGHPVPIAECMLTALIDTQGSAIHVTLPGGIRVGSPEADIVKGFPEFAGLAMDGEGGFRGNELVYGCNVRSDGSNGYLIVNNDPPYYSTVSLVCEQGVVIEISFECIGSVRAKGVFLD